MRTVSNSSSMARWVMSCGALAIVLAAADVPAKAPACTIKVTPQTAKKASEAELAQMSKITRSEAEQAARAGLKADNSATIKSGELEAENGCLLWSFDVKVPGKSGISEVQIDAGDGHLLSVTHETPAHEGAEAKQDAKARSKAAHGKEDSESEAETDTD